MAQYEAFDPDVEVYGQTIRTMVDDALARISEEYRQLAREALAKNRWLIRLPTNGIRRRPG